MNIIIFLLLLSCSKYVTPRDQFELECMIIFENILNIQGQRGYLSDNMQHISRLRKEKKISKKKHEAFSAEWINKEAYLRNKVAKVYDEAYEKGCFEKAQ